MDRRGARWLVPSTLVLGTLLLGACFGSSDGDEAGGQTPTSSPSGPEALASPTPTRSPEPIATAPAAATPTPTATPTATALTASPTPTASPTSAATATASPTPTEPPPTPSTGTSVGVRLTDPGGSAGVWGVTPDRATVPPGDVTFAVTEDGDFYHEFVVIRTDLPPNALPLDGGGRRVDEAQVEVVGTLLRDMSMSTRSATFRLEPGRYVLICNIPTHYSSGMRTAFTVAEAE